MAAAKTKTKSSAKKPAARQIKASAYKSFKLNKKVKQSKPLIGSFRLFRASLRHLKQHWRLFGGIVLTYLVLTTVLVKGFGIDTGVADLKSSLEDIFTGAAGELTTGLSLFTVMLSSVGSSNNGVTGLYQTILLIIASLAVIWAMRQTYGNQKAAVRDAFYKGMYPLVPFLLVMGVIGLQLLPMMLGVWVYGAVIGGGVAVTGFEQAVTWLIVGLLSLVSLYMLASSVFALYIVTLPDMTPLKALRSAREIVRYRRWTVLRKVLALPLMVLVLGAIIMLPIIIWLTPVAEWSFFILNMAVLAVLHSYLYRLYRELL